MSRIDQSFNVSSFPTAKLPLLSVNHISFAVPLPKRTAKFFEQVLGFKIIKRPQAFDSIDGAWVCGMGLEIHFIQPKTLNTTVNRNIDRFNNVISDKGIDPRNDHLSFLCTDTGLNSPWNQVINMLEEANVKYLHRSYPDDDLQQLFFCDPTSGILIEVSTNPKC